MHIRHFGRNESALKLVTHPRVIMKAVDLPRPRLERIGSIGDTAVITQFNFTEAICVPRDSVPDAAQHPTPFGRMQFSPRSFVKGRFCSSHCPIHIFGITVRQSCPSLTRCRILAFKIIFFVRIVPGIRHKILIGLHVLKAPPLSVEVFMSR